MHANARVAVESLDLGLMAAIDFAVLQVVGAASEDSLFDLLSAGADMDRLKEAPLHDLNLLLPRLWQFVGLGAGLHFCQ